MPVPDLNGVRTITVPLKNVLLEALKEGNAYPCLFLIVQNRPFTGSKSPSNSSLFGILKMQEFPIWNQASVINHQSILI
jgi:hypothetical protein